MLNPKAKRTLLPIVLAIAIAIAVGGCGGGDDSSTTSEGTGVAPATTKPPAAKKAEDATAQTKQPGKRREDRKRKAREDRSERAKARKVVRKLAESGKPVPADSPVAKELLESLSKGKRGKKQKQRPDPVEKAVEEVIAPTGSGDDPKGGSSGGDPGAGVEKILEQIQE